MNTYRDATTEPIVAIVKGGCIRENTANVTHYRCCAVFNQIDAKAVVRDYFCDRKPRHCRWGDLLHLENFFLKPGNKPRFSIGKLNFDKNRMGFIA